MHINPDHFLQTETGRVIDPERNRIAWEKSFEALNDAVARAGPSATLYVLVGAQGSGKSTWGRARHLAEPEAILFDAIVVRKAERERILLAARSRSIETVAVWFNTPLGMCLARNAARAPDEVVPERAVRNVHAAIEIPTTAEGFERIIEVVPGESAG